MKQRGYNGSRLGAKVFDPPLELVIFFASALQSSSHDRRIGRLQERIRLGARQRLSNYSSERRLPRKPKASSQSS